MKWIFILIGITFFVTPKVSNAQRHCKCRGWQMNLRDDFNQGKHKEVLTDGELQHPVTTFSRENGGWFDPTDDQEGNLASLRKEIKDRHTERNNIDDQRFDDLYEDIIIEANKSIGTYDITAVGKESDNARIAKAAAFVFLADIDGSGTTLGDTKSDEYRDKAIEAILRLKWSSSKNPDDLFYGPSSFGYSTKSYWLSKTLIMLLQAYDYLKAADPDNDDVIECGKVLQCYTKHLFDAGSSSLWGNYFKRNNHSLMIAGAVGLASVVLADHTASVVEPNYQPEVWASSSHWRILKTLFDESESKHESKRGDVYGFGEGPHYFRMSFENLMPFFLAYKNGNPEIDQTLKYGPKGETRRKWSFAKREELNTTYWDDPDIENLIIWFADMKMPSGEYLNTDDSHINQHFVGITTFRKPYLTKHLVNEDFANLDARYVDFRPDILAAMAEGFLLEDAQFNNSAVAHASGDVHLTLKAYGNPNSLLDRLQTFYFNAESETNGSLYYPKQVQNRGFFFNRDVAELVDAHEQWDDLSFILAQGGKYLMLDGGYDGDEPAFLDKTENHNTIAIYKSNGEKIPAKEGTAEITDFRFKGDKGLIIGRVKMATDVWFKRRVDFYSVDGERFYIIDDQMIGTPQAVDNHTFWSHWHGKGLSPGTFTFDNDIKRAIWDGHCTGPYDPRVEAHFRSRCDAGATVSFENFTGYHKESVDKGVFATHTQVITKVSGAETYHMQTLIAPTYCSDSSFLRFKPVTTTGGGGTKISPSTPDKTGASLWTDLNLRDFADPFDRWDNDTLRTDAKNLWIVLNTNLPTAGCVMKGFIDQYSLDSGKTITLNDTVIFKSVNRVEYADFEYYDKYYYQGQVTTIDGNDSIIFYLPDVPSPQLSNMTELNGLNVDYDTTKQEMTLILPTAGTYDFHFGPEFPCLVSCFFPPDSIADTFYFDSGATQRLGHQLAIVQDSAWLDITKGSKMVICAKAVLRNRDSLSLSSLQEKKFGYNNDPYGQNYLSSENQAYRENFSIGSGAWIHEDAPGRSMIIVQNKGALVLKDSSHTNVGCGGTILVRSGGTLKIEDGASVTIGDECGGFGEIILEDSAYLCIESGASIEFFNGRLDTSDKHIFFVSQNPKNPAISGVADSSNASGSNACIDFCDLKDTFPTHGIGNHPHGWFNVGKPEAWFYTDSLVCDGKDVWIDGKPTLNESRYRFEVCEYDPLAFTCIGSTSIYPDNSLDDYWGGRISRLNLTDTAQLLRNKIYKITLKVLNDCADEASYSRVISIPTELIAQVDGDTLMCGGQGVVKVHGLNSTGLFDSLQWSVWEYQPPFEYDSTTYIQNADTYVVKIDTIWIDKGVSYDTIIIDTLHYYFADTAFNDSLKYHGDYKNYFDTTIIDNEADTFKFPSVTFDAGKKYAVRLTLFNGCTWSHDTLFVRMRPGPSVDAGRDKYIGASHSSVTHVDPALEGVVTGHSGSHTWSPTTNLTPSTSLTPVANPSSTTTYTLSATDAHGCTNTDEVTVFKNTFANAGADTTICYDDSAKVGIPSQIGYTYEWFPSASVSDNAIAEPYAYPNAATATTIIKVKVIDDLMNVEWDDIVIAKDTTIDPIFDQSGGPPYNATLTNVESRVGTETLTWNFGDGSPTTTGQMVSHQFPSVPSAAYNACVSYVNACGTIQWCDSVKFDAMGNHIPNPPEPASLEKATDIQPISLSASPNPFRNETVLIYSLGTAQQAVLELYAVQGQRLESYQLSGNEGTQMLNLAAYPAGVYTARLLINGHRAEQQKLVIMR